MASLTVDTLLQHIKTLFQNYDCYDIYFLDKNRIWQTNPQIINETISSEFWFRIWSIAQTPDGMIKIQKFFAPIIENPNFSKLIKKFKNGDELNATFELFYSLIEYEVYNQIINKYIPEWDYKEKKRQKEFIQKAEDFKKQLSTLLEAELAQSFFHLFIEYESNPLFKIISKIVSEEIWFNEQKNLVKDKLKENSKTAFIYENLSINFVPETGASITEPAALVRLLVKKLKEDTSLSLGEQYEIISLLGALKDTRCARTLFDILNKTKIENVNLLSAIIYALGNVRYKGMLKRLKEILDMPEYIEISSSKYKQSLYEIKGEVLWALGKLGMEGRSAIDGMIKLRNHKDNSVKIALAWALGMIGEEEKNIEGTLEVEILTTLIEFLNERDKKIFEEALYSLKKINFYEIIERLNLRNIPATPILSLKPSSIGLYELSETIYHLMSLKQPVIMAVTGDSGTGKTYFCEAIKDGFGDIAKDDILYLMRDNPAHRTIFSKIIDPELVKGFLDPQYYTIETMDERKITPSEAFVNLIKQNTHKKLIILDGWLDDIYFYQVLKAFYLNNSLDCIVNFRTTYSTRRINLETREGILERVRDCLRFVENPAIEETEFYRNGDVFVYNLDNSIGSRLSNEEIKEIFSRRKVGSWADYIRIGRFEKERKELLTEEGKVTEGTEKIMMDAGDNIHIEEHSIEIQTEHFLRTLNDNIINEPNLLQTIEFNKSSPQRISFFSPGVIAYTGKSGIVGLLTGINNQNHSTEIQEKNISGLCIHNDLICTMDVKSCIYAVDFNKNKLLTIRNDSPPMSVIASDHQNTIVTGHQNGIITLWNMDSKKTKILNGHNNRVVGILIAKGGKIVSADLNGELRVWNLREGVVKIYKDERFATEQINVNQYSGTIILVKEKSVFIINPMSDQMSKLTINGMDNIAACCPYYDGRIFACFEKNSKGVLGVIELQDGTWNYAIIGHQDEKTTDIVTMGPRIITTCKNCLHIWGSESYVRGEIERLKILRESKRPFYYHSMIF